MASAAPTRQPDKTPSREWLGVMFLCVIPSVLRACWIRLATSPGGDTTWGSTDFDLAGPVGLVIQFGPTLVVLWCLLSLGGTGGRDLGWRTQGWARQVIEGAVLCTADLLLVHLVTPVIPPTLAELDRARSLVAPHAAWALLSIAVMPVSILVEEIARAYFIERSHTRSLGAVVAIVAMSATHLHLATDVWLATSLGFSVIYTLFFLWRRSLLSLVVAHTLFNLGALVLRVVEEVRW